MLDLIPVDVPVSKYGSEETFNKVAKQTVFLPRVQLYGSNSTLVKKGKMGLGRYGFVRSKDVVVDMTTEFNCIVLGWRPKALRIDGDDTKAWYNPQSAEFKAVEEDSKTADSGCMFGPEFIIYIPDQNEFATMFFGNPTFRRAAPKMRSLINKAATLGSTLIEKQKYSWHGPIITECTTPLNMPVGDDLEKFKAELRQHLINFNNPPETEVEVAEGTEPERVR